MLAHDVRDALNQVKRLQALILEKRMFRGYSGIARMVGGLAAMGGALVMAAPGFPALPAAHLRGWAAVLAIALTVNYGMLVFWFFSVPDARRALREILPAFDAVPPLAVGAGLSLALVMRGQYDLLFGTWMCLYGLAQLPYRNSLPFANYILGLGYLAGGAVLLIWPGFSFTRPLPMGLVFGAGELAGGWILYRLNLETALEQKEDIRHDDA